MQYVNNQANGSQGIFMIYSMQDVNIFVICGNEVK